MASECPFLSIVLSEHLKGRLLHRGHPARAEMNPSIHHLCLQYLQDTCPHCISSNCWSLASTGHDHILKQHKIRLNLLILVYPITRGQKERGNQGTGPLQGTKTFCMKTSKSAALVQDFKVSRFQDFSWIFFLGSGKMSPFFVSLLCIYLETCYLSAESTRHFPPDKSLGKCFVRQQQLLEEYLREV